jgi:hypothetical protein
MAAVLPGCADAALFAPAKAHAATGPRGNVVGSASRMTSWNKATVGAIVAETRAAVAAARRTGGKVGGLPSENVSVYNQQAIAAYAPTTPTTRGYGVDMTPDTCEFYIRQAERQYGIPPYLLHAISLTESGRGGRPNPYAMNLGGRAYSAPDVATMVSVASANWGSRNVDVGCMQISLNHHASRFYDWRTLLNPQYNVEYAAYYLAELHHELGTWTRAVGAYHSRTPWRGANYVCLVTRRWGQIFGSDRPGCGPNLEQMAQLLYRNVSWTS